MKFAELVQDCIDLMDGSVPRLAEAIGVNRGMPLKWLKEPDRYWNRLIPVYVMRGLAKVRRQSLGAFVNEVEEIRWSNRDLFLAIERLPIKDRITIASLLLESLADKEDSLLSANIRLVSEALKERIEPKCFSDFLQWYCAENEMPYSPSSIPKLFGDIPDSQGFARKCHEALQNIILGESEFLESEFTIPVWRSIQDRLNSPSLSIATFLEINNCNWYSDFSMLK